MMACAQHLRGVRRAYWSLLDQAQRTRAQSRLRAACCALMLERQNGFCSPAIRGDVHWAADITGFVSGPFSAGMQISYAHRPLWTFECVRARLAPMF